MIVFILTFCVCDDHILQMLLSYIALYFTFCVWLCAILGFEPMTLLLLVPCSDHCATGSNIMSSIKPDLQHFNDYFVVVHVPVALHITSHRCWESASLVSVVVCPCVDTDDTSVQTNMWHFTLNQRKWTMWTVQLHVISPLAIFSYSTDNCLQWSVHCVLCEVYYTTQLTPHSPCVISC